MMTTYQLKLVEGYSRLDYLAKELLERASEYYGTLLKARKELRRINLRISRSLGKNEHLPRIDILSSEGTRYKWGG